MFERRLYLHLDWLLLGAVLLLCRIGLPMIYSTTYDPIRPASAREFYTQLSAVGSAWWRWPICPAHRLPHAGRVRAGDLRWRGRPAAVRALLRRGRPAARVAGSTSAPINLQPSEFAKIGAGAVLATLFGGATARRCARVTCSSPAAPPPAARASSHASPTSAPPSRWCRCCGGIAFVAGLRMRRRRPCRPVLRAPRARRVDVRAEGLPEVAHRDVPRPDAGRRAARATSRFRPASPSGRAASRARASGRARRASTSSCRSRTTTSSSRCWPRSTASSACSSRSGSTCSSCCARSTRRGWPRTASARTSWWGSSRGFTFQVVYNITMSAGLAPVKGLTLPLMSYGGSSMIATLAGFGLILNVRMRRFTN